MSNPSLKEQLQALSLEVPSSRTDNKKKKKSVPIESSASKPKPAWLEQAQYGVELLKVYFPACFKENKEVQPLKIGIKQDLVKQISTLNNVVLSDKNCMVNSLVYYVNSTAYHKSVVQGVVRVDLEGKPAGVVTAEEALYSAERCQAKLKKRKNLKSNKETHMIENQGN